MFKRTFLVIAMILMLALSLSPLGWGAGQGNNFHDADLNALLNYIFNVQADFAGFSADGSITVSSGVIQGASPLVFEGATANDYETTVAVTDPTADRIVTLPNASGTAVLSSLATNAPDAANSVTGASNAVVFEGATADDYETSIAPTDPTADRTFTLPNLSGTVGLILGTGANVSLPSTLATNGVDVANSVSGGTNQLIFEGATADDYETIVTPTDATADRTLTLPNKSGTVMLSSAASALTPGGAVALTVGLSNIYTDTPTDNEDQTITFSGAGTAGDVISIIFTCTGTADEVITFHATLVSSTGTLTCGTTAARYYVVTFVSDGSHWYEVSRTAVQT